MQAVLKVIFPLRIVIAGSRRFAKSSPHLVQFKAVGQVHLSDITVRHALKPIQSVLLGLTKSQTVAGSGDKRHTMVIIDNAPFQSNGFYVHRSG